MKILVVGGGGREHALVWKISQSPLVDAIFCAPGNAGTEQIAQNVAISPEDIGALLEFAKSNGVDLCVVGPEAPLVAGIVDEFSKEGLKVVGPRRDAARLEGSKAFAKRIMAEYGVPTAEFKTFDAPADALAYIRDAGAPIVVKADGLAAGKGVYVCRTLDDAERAVDEIMVQRKFGASGDRVVVEGFLAGEEASFIVFTDGRNILPMASSQDHKPVYDNDEGPNTGGMGAYSPAPVVTDEVYGKIMERIMEPVIRGMKREGREFRGVLYAGLMIVDGEPYVLEFNVRFGDPETQPLLVRMKSDIVPILLGCTDTLEGHSIEWDDRWSVCVVMASGGYPGKYEKGKEIFGLDKIDDPDVVIFHAGTKRVDGKVLTSGGRVLGVTALGDSLEEAQRRAYSAVEKISWDGVHYRRDIGDKAKKWLGA
ncbi:MAG TPA: phosphoribosylamine--glycine ligase [Proteobacteria bacterium]|nr:phosphoribosylamine--glycine ligase [Pseudomonadota bacterium]